MTTKKTKFKTKLICLITLCGLTWGILAQPNGIRADVTEKMYNVSYWSDSTKQDALMQQALNQIFGNGDDIIGSEEIYDRAVKIAATIENDVMQIIKNTSDAPEDDADARIQALVDKIYNSSDGILDQIQTLYTQWGLDPEDQTTPLDDPDTRLPAAELYYKSEAKLTYPATYYQDVLNQLITDINSYVSSSLSEQELVTEFTDPITNETETLPEYSIASRDLHDLVTSEKSLITGKDYTYWSDDPKPTTLVEVAGYFKQLTYIRARAIYQKYKDHIENQLSQIYALHKEISDITGTISASPYDMGTIMQTIQEKINTLYAIGSMHTDAEEPDNGFDGMSNTTTGGTSTEPMNYRDFADMQTNLDQLLSDADSAVLGYRGQYESNPNLSDSATYGAFENARGQIVQLRDAALRYALEMADVLEARLEEANLKLELLEEKIGSSSSASSATSQIWSDIKNALANIVNWLLSTFGRLLNYGMNELNEIGSLKDIHSITLAFANMGFLLILTFAGLAISMEWNTPAYSIKKIIPRFVGSVILVNASLTIAQIVTDLALIITNVFLTQAGNITNANIELFSRTGTNTLGLSAGAPTLLFGSLLSSDFVSLGNSLFSNDLVALIILILVFIVTAAVDILLIIRTAGIWLLVITAPVAFLLWLLPTFQDIFKVWWKQFFRLVLIGPMVAIIFLIGISLARIGIADDFLRVFIGIGTFGLILASPSFMNFFTISIKKTIQKDTTNVTKNKVYQPNFQPGAGLQQSAGGSDTKGKVTQEYLQQIKNTLAAPTPDIKLQQNITDLDPRAITSIVQSGGMQDTPVDELSRMFKKLDERQQDAVLSTLDSRSSNNTPLWTPEQKATLKQLVPEERITKARLQPDILGKSQKENLDVAKLIRQSQQKSQRPGAVNTTGLIKSLIDPKAWGDLKNQLGKLKENNLLGTNLLEGLFKIKQSINFLGQMLTGQDPKEKELAIGMIDQYYRNDPPQIMNLTEDIKSEQPQTAQASAQILRAGIESLGNMLQSDPKNAQLNDIATRLVSQIPDYLVDLLQGTDAKRSDRELFISNGIQQSANPDQTSASIIANLEQEDIQAIGDNIAIAGITNIINNSPEQLNSDHVEKILNSMEKNSSSYLPVLQALAAKVTAEASLEPAQRRFKPEVAEKIMQSKEIIEKYSNQVSLDSQTIESIAKQDEQHKAAPTMQIPEISGLSARELLDHVTIHPDQLKASDINALLSQAKEQPDTVSPALRSIVDNFNKNFGSFGQPSALSEEGADQIAQNANMLAGMGLPIKLNDSQLQPQKPAAEKIIRLPQSDIKLIPDDLFIPAVAPLTQLTPQLVLPEHVMRALEGLKQDPEKFKPAVYTMLSPAFDLKDETLAFGIRQLAEQQPQFVLPQHVDTTLNGLDRNKQLYTPTAEELFALYNQAQGQFGQPGQLNLPATAQLAMQVQDFANILPHLTLVPSPPTDDELNAKITSQVDPEAIQKLPQQILLSGLSLLLNQNPKEVSPEHALGMLNASKTNPEFIPLMHQLADKFNHTDLENGHTELGMDTLLALGAGQEELASLGIELDKNVLQQVSGFANNAGVDYKGIDSMEKAIKEIPRALKPPPGRAGGGESSRVTTIRETTTIKQSGSPAVSKKELTREGLSHEDIAKRASTSNDDIKDFASNVKNDQGVGIIRPEN